MATLLTLLILLAPPRPASLDGVAAALRSSPGWQASFLQTYLPAGFSTGAEDAGELLVAAPDRLRFEYRGEGARVFAVDGLIAREVDAGASLCHAFSLDRTSWSRLPLSALLDPAAAATAFVVAAKGVEIRLLPRAANPDLAAVVITVGERGLPAEIVIEDPAANRNRFRFDGWRPLAAVDASLFAPRLAGQPPCTPEEW